MCFGSWTETYRRRSCTSTTIRTTVPGCSVFFRLRKQQRARRFSSPKRYHRRAVVLCDHRAHRHLELLPSTHPVLPWPRSIFGESTGGGLAPATGDTGGHTGSPMHASMGSASL